MMKWVRAALLLMMVPSLVWAAGSIWAQKKGDSHATPFPGTQAGLDSAKAFCGNNGVVQTNPGQEGLSVGTIPVGVTIIRVDSVGWRNYSKVIIDDSLRVNKRLMVGGAEAADDWVTKIIRGQAVLNFDLSVNATDDKTFPVTGVVDRDQVFLGVPAASVSANTIYFAWVSATDSVTIRAVRTCDSTPNPASGTFMVTVFH